MPRYTFIASNGIRLVVKAHNEATARTEAMATLHGWPEPFGLAPELASAPVRPRGRAVYPTAWLGHGLTLVTTEPNDVRQSPQGPDVNPGKRPTTPNPERRTRAGRGYYLYHPRRTRDTSAQ